MSLMDLPLSELTEIMGFGTIAEVARTVNKPRETLYDWGIKNPDLLRAVIIGAVEVRKHNRMQEKEYD